ncbi:MAG: asparaginase [Bacteroidota bacterium]
MQQKTNKARILLIYTGGTIGMVKDYRTGALKAFNFNDLLTKIPELYQLECSISSIAFKHPLDSSNMSPLVWSKLAEIIEGNYKQFDGFVVLHGSDTMSYTAAALSFMLENLRKPVILTGSQLPIGDLRTDAKENLITAIQIASLTDGDEAVVQEVCLYFEYKLYRGNRTTKINAEHFQAFNSPNYPPLLESGVRLDTRYPYLYRCKDRTANLVVHKKMDASVGVLKLFPGLSIELLNAVLNASGLRVLVLETFGAGNAPTADGFLTALREAIENGLHIINVTQCVGGSVLMGQYETSEHLGKIQLVNGKDITTESAVTKAMYLLGKDTPDTQFKGVFESPLRGEMRQN